MPGGYRSNPSAVGTGPCVFAPRDGPAVCRFRLGVDGAVRVCLLVRRHSVPAWLGSGIERAKAWHDVTCSDGNQHRLLLQHSGLPGFDGHEFLLGAGDAHRHHAAWSLGRDVFAHGGIACSGKPCQSAAFHGRRLHARRNPDGPPRRTPARGRPHTGKAGREDTCRWVRRTGAFRRQ